MLGGSFPYACRKTLLFDEYLHVIFHRRCGSRISAAKKASMERKFSAQRKLPSKDALVSPVIDVNFNIIAANNTVAGGWIRYVSSLFSSILFYLMLVFQPFTGIESNRSAQQGLQGVWYPVPLGEYNQDSQQKLVHQRL